MSRLGVSRYEYGDVIMVFLLVLFSICVQQPCVDFSVQILENIEDHFFHAGFCIHELLHGLHGDFRRLFIGKVELPVEMQQNATLSRPFSAASSRQER